MDSPYKSVNKKNWRKITTRLINEHPLMTNEIVKVVLLSWNSIFDSKFGTQGFKIGIDIFPKPQTMGFLLHELIPLEFVSRYPKLWRIEQKTEDKDIVYIPDVIYSIEIKTSSNARHIYGNRSYAQETTRSKKVKSGYYLTVNFEKFSNSNRRPEIRLIRFGWIDSNDWIGQKAATGQQSRLQNDVENFKLIKLYSRVD